MGQFLGYIFLVFLVWGMVELLFERPITQWRINRLEAMAHKRGFGDRFAADVNGFIDDRLAYAYIPGKHRPLALEQIYLFALNRYRKLKFERKG